VLCGCLPHYKRALPVGVNEMLRAATATFKVQDGRYRQELVYVLYDFPIRGASVCVNRHDHGVPLV
jgi:hypothetical protein